MSEQPAFPVIPGVAFKHIPEANNYAISSDGRVWALHKGKTWKRIKTRDLETGPDSIWLPGRGGFVARSVPDLFRSLFGPSPAPYLAVG